MSIHGHFWTCVPHVYGAFRPPALQRGIAWEGRGRDGVAIVGRLHLPTNPTNTLIVVVHGLGSDHDRPYTRTGARAALDVGAAVLRIELRGGGLDPRGLYHAGLLSDFEAILDSPALREFSRIHVLGYSLGGHLALTLGVDTDDDRIGRVAALCAPLDLAATQRHIDRRRSLPYRVNVLAGLKASYKMLAARQPVPTPWSTVKRIQTIRAWDAKIVVPFFGFASVDDYYASVSAGPRLGQLKRDALIVMTHADPMVPIDTVRPFLDAPRVTSRVLHSGGHVYFPAGAHLGFGEMLGVEAQSVAWLLAG